MFELWAYAAGNMSGGRKEFENKACLPAVPVRHVHCNNMNCTTEVLGMGLKTRTIHRIFERIKLAKHARGCRWRCTGRISVQGHDQEAFMNA